MKMQGMVKAICSPRPGLRRSETCGRLKPAAQPLSRHIAPRFAPTYPRPGKPFTNKNVAKGYPAPIHDAQLAAEPIFVATDHVKPHWTRVKERMQSLLCAMPELGLSYTTRRVDFGRINVGEANFLPSSQKVSPSTTQLSPPPLGHSPKRT